MIRETVGSSGKTGSVLYWTTMPLIIARIALVFLFFLIFFQETVTMCFFASLTVGKRRPLSRGSAGIVAFCFLYACSDEIHQYFVPGRACMFRDILLDTAGGTVGILITMLLWAIISLITKKRTASS